MEETKYEIETYYSPRKVLEKVKAEKNKFNIELFEEDQEFTLVPKDNMDIKLFCKYETVNGRTIIHIDAVESSIKGAKGLEKTYNGLWTLQFGFSVLIGSFFLSYILPQALMIFIVMAILLGAMYWTGTYGTTRTNEDAEANGINNVKQLEALFNGDIIKKIKG
ncbi:MAG: hypothetical protein GY810_01710 [Aureispira sp.]|nr:hypothetical protein [Aureispira sp.]